MEQLVINAIKEVFNIKVDPLQVYLADEDPAQWAPSAKAIIYHHGNMPSIERIEEWAKVSKLLPDLHYVEAINNEVSAVFTLY
tara:strand:+ start:8481 stop:8729 length:249 start_codon:yes stop_codon:yes gene_type:complete